jgi:hypothetical protein
MYNNIFKRVEAEHKARCVDLVNAIATDERALAANSTQTRWSQYQKGKISHEQAVEFAVKRQRDRMNRELAKERELLEAIENAPSVQSIAVFVTWKRSACWGSNPTACVTVSAGGRKSQYENRAGGCGYDKLSACVASALNESMSVKKLLHDKKESVLSVDPEASSHSAIGYGAGYGATPYLEGGVGMSSLISVLEACGMKLEDSWHTKDMDAYAFQVSKEA